MTGVDATSINLFYVGSTNHSAENLTAPGADFSNSYLVGVDFSGSDGIANLQSTKWLGANLVGADFSYTDLGTNNSGGVNHGNSTQFNGAYLHGAKFEQALLDNVVFTNSYWDALGSGGNLIFLMPLDNLNFTGFWRGTSLPDCPPSTTWDSGHVPPVTNGNNTCPDGTFGSCDGKWDTTSVDISQAHFKSAKGFCWGDVTRTCASDKQCGVGDDAICVEDANAFPQVPGVDPDNQCGGANNPADRCWVRKDDPPSATCLPYSN